MERIRNGLLHCESEHSPLALPIGMPLTNRMFRDETHSLRSAGAAVYVVDNADPNRRTQIHPRYDRTVNLRLKSLGVTTRIRFWLATDRLDSGRALNLIEREHYLSSPASGLLLCASIPDAAARIDLTNALRRAKKTVRRGGLPELAGCVTLGVLGHGNPAGREALAEALGEGDISSLTRKECLQLLRPAWLSRIAVVTELQQEGSLGTALCKEARRAASTHFFPQPRSVEVIRTVPKARAEEILAIRRNAGQRDFLQSAGFDVFSQPMRSRPMAFGADTEAREQAAKLYYFSLL